MKTMENRKAVVLLSGGMDSTTLLYYVLKRLNITELHALSFRYGQRHAREIEMAEWQANKAGVYIHNIMDVTCLGGLSAGVSALTDIDVEMPDLASLSDEERQQPVTYVPNRNMIFLSLAAAYAESKGIEDVFYGAQAQDRYGYWDCTVDFIEAINNVLSLNRKVAVTIHAPFVEKTKKQIIEIGLELGVDYEHTWTCYRGGEQPCGECPSCMERDSAFCATPEEEEKRESF